jgi:hypothetical protein
MPEGAAVVRHDLRESTHPAVERRRGIVGLSLFSGAVLGGIALYQVGIAKRLPDPPLPGFSADVVHGSEQAYAMLQTPDALLGLASYAVTACLAGMGPGDRAQSEPWIPLAMAAKASVDAAMAARLSVQQWTKIGKRSLWSLLVAGATLGTAYLSIPEARAACKQLR